jgi:anti-anti-sigma regulatory factor
MSAATQTAAPLLCRQPFIVHEDPLCCTVLMEAQAGDHPLLHQALATAWVERVRGRTVVIDCRALTLVNSAVVGFLVRTIARLGPGQVRITGANQAVERQLRLAGVARLAIIAA